MEIWLIEDRNALTSILMRSVECETFVLLGGKWMGESGAVQCNIFDEPVSLVIGWSKFGYGMPWIGTALKMILFTKSGLFFYEFAIVIRFYKIAPCSTFCCHKKLPLFNLMPPHDSTLFSYHFFGQIKTDSNYTKIIFTHKQVKIVSIISISSLGVQIKNCCSTFWLKQK